MRPFPLVPIEARRHVVASPVRTRFGLGEYRIDHAAGLPLSVRRSSPPPPSQPLAQGYYTPAPSAPVQRMRYDDEPVELPLKSSSTIWLIAAAVLVAFVVAIAGMFFSGISTTTLITRSNAVTAPPSTVNASTHP